MLIHKAVNALAPFTATKDEDRTAIQKIYISENECVATDGHAMAIMPNHDAGFADGDYPFSGIKTDDFQPVLVSKEELKPAIDYLPKKPTLPILNLIQRGRQPCHGA